MEQLHKERKVPVFQVPKPKRGAGGKVVLKDFHINVVDSDFLREMILLELPALAPSLAVVFDEVDTCYDATLRTSACRRLAMLAPVFVAPNSHPDGQECGAFGLMAREHGTIPSQQGQFLGCSIRHGLYTNFVRHCRRGRA